MRERASGSDTKNNREPSAEDTMNKKKVPFSIFKHFLSLSLAFFVPYEMNIFPDSRISTTTMKKQTPNCSIVNTLHYLWRFPLTTLLLSVSVTPKCE